ncbi:hypothetical protein [Pseudoneobacillus rhizosphaerae]|jgi:hypothetical protein|uniref:Uncharacterized protein n=1 Tax=Pseudoneobacillus rhizosphaerae TaxID=2880968 RepID=A0A9C7L8Y6_9BACI|nr:hypothetical protein [Pseudoneobacillus rhizosphaerae]CAG9606342.1 hypothetical protein NEOCIP111885_00030 [Pseudoneobacillus rhizosphaerae]
MSEYQQFLVERNKVDFLIQKGYLINNILENLNGSYVDFIHPNDQSKETLHISTANGRKYFSSILIKQNTTSYIKNE